MPQTPEQKRRYWILILALLAFAMQVLKLGGRFALLHQPPGSFQWLQVVLIALLFIYLWEGKPWARPAAISYFLLMTFTGIGLLLLIGWSLPSALFWISVLDLAVVLNIALLLLWVKDLR